MKKIFDLPAHPFFVHLPVVLIPLIAMATIIVAIRPARSVGIRQRFGWLFVGSAAVILAFTLLAASSGEELEDVLELGKAINKHRQLGERVRWFVAAFAVLLCGWVAAARVHLTTSARKVLMHVLTVTVVASGVLATVWVVRTGHEGARVTWKPVLDQPN